MPPFKLTETENSLRLEFYIPESSNALSLAAARDLARAGKTARKVKKPVIVLSHHPRMFCSGGNLTDYKKLKGKAPGLKINREIQKHLEDFGRWPVPKLALIDGDVLGGGMEWLAHFDFRWSSPNALFAFWQRRIGLSTGWGGGRAWSSLIGERAVRRALLDGRLLGAGEALRLGWIDRVVASWCLEDEAELWASRLRGEAVNRLTAWADVKEAKIFSDLWMGKEHATVLEKWSGGPTSLPKSADMLK